MFLEIDRLNRRGANERPTLVKELIRIDLIQKMRPKAVTDWDQPCVELDLEGEQTVCCQGTFEGVLEAIEGGDK
jgi:hypothetical protein